MKIKYLIWILLMTSIHHHAKGQTQDWFWAKNVGDIKDDESYATAVDASGNIYITGRFYSDSITFGATTLTNVGMGDVFIAKYDPLGNPVWAKSAGGADDDVSAAIAIDASGNIVITGYFFSTSIIFDNDTLVNDTTDGSQDIFIAKYDSSGKEIWAKRAGGNSLDNSHAIAADAHGNVYITGSFYSTTIKFGSTTLGNSGLYDVFIAKYDSNGTSLWAKSAVGSGDEEGFGIAVEAGGNAYITGYFKSLTVTFGTKTLTNDSTDGSRDIFIVKYDMAGNVMWAKSAKGKFEDLSNAITVSKGNSVCISGTYFSSKLVFGSITLMNPDTNYYDIFIAKYDSSGNVLWAKTAGGNSDDGAYAVASDPGGNIWITGYYYSSTIAFGSTVLSNLYPNYTNIFVAKYDMNGNALWAEGMGGISDDVGYSVAADAPGNVYVTGEFFSPAISFNTINLLNSTNQGTSDLFLARYSFTIGIDELMTIQDPVIIFPNPVTSSSVLRMNSSSPGVKEIVVSDMLGKEVLRKSFNGDRINIEKGHLQPGLYFVKVTGMEGEIVTKMMVQ